MGFAEISTSTLIVGAIISILIGIAFCFFGYRIFRILLAILGFIAGAAAGVAAVTAILVQQGTTTGQTLYLIIGGLVGGIIGAVLLYFLYIVGVFLLGAALGAILAAAIVPMLTNDRTALTVAVIGLGLVGGVLAIILQRVLIIIATSFSGAQAIVSGVTLLINPRRGLPLATGPISGQLQGLTAPAPAMDTIALIAWLVLAIAGMVVQFVWTGKKKPKPAAAGAVPYGVPVGGTPQVNVTVTQQYGTPAPAYQPPAPPPVVVQTPPQPVPVPTPIIVQAPDRAVPVISAPEQPALPSATPPAEPGAVSEMGRFCPNCGQPLSTPVSFCPNCGNPVAALWQ